MQTRVQSRGRGSSKQCTYCSMSLLELCGDGDDGKKIEDDRNESAAESVQTIRSGCAMGGRRKSDDRHVRRNKQGCRSDNERRKAELRLTYA